MAMAGNRRVIMGLERRGFVPVAFATLLEAQIWETGMATDLRGANTLPGISGCCPGSGEHVQSCWAGWGSLNPAGSSPVEGALTPLGCSWAQPRLCNASPSDSASAPRKCRLASRRACLVLGRQAGSQQGWFQCKYMIAVDSEITVAVIIV